MRILGIDPGYGIVGYGIIEHTRGKSRYLGHGAITTAAGTPWMTALRGCAPSLAATSGCSLTRITPLVGATAANAPKSSPIAIKATRRTFLRNDCISDKLFVING